jgi:hypothetical protein
MDSIIYTQRVIAALQSSPDSAAWWDLYDKFLPTRVPVRLTAARSKSGRPCIVVTDIATGQELVKIIIHSSVLGALTRGTYVPSSRNYFTTPPTRVNIIRYWQEAVRWYVTSHSSILAPEFVRVYNDDVQRVYAVAATLPYTEQGGRPAVCWNAVGLSYFGDGSKWTWLSRGVSQYGYAFTAAGKAYESRISGENEYLSIILRSRTYNAYYARPTLDRIEAIARTLTTWKRGPSSPTDLTLATVALNLLKV